METFLVVEATKKTREEIGIVVYCKHTHMHTYISTYVGTYVYICKHNL